MCEHAIKTNIELNLHCTKCGSEHIVSAHKYEDTNSELGFHVTQLVYKCEDCGEEFFLCPECNGTGYITSYDDIDDCEICHSMGVINKE